MRVDLNDATMRYEDREDKMQKSRISYDTYKKRSLTQMV